MTRLICGILISWSFYLPTANGQSNTSSWQQRVYYSIEVSLDTQHHQMNGREKVVYYNNSPDTLNRVFFHLYFNAFQPYSMMAQRNRELPDPDRRVVPRIFQLKPDEIGYHRILSLQQDDQPVKFHVYDTILEVELAHPILPGDSTTFTIQFHAQIPLQTRRSGWMNREGIEYSMSQWYPKIAAYDERGWHADPYIGREFYGVFGSFDVRITLPANYIVGATGTLQNPAEVGHGYTNHPVATDQDSLTWHFIAHNVHDFAWAADPDYIHEQFTDSSGITIHLLYQPDVATTWQSMKKWVPELLHYYSQRIGPYPYPQFTVAQAGDGGMEYPQIIFITGRRSPRSLLGVTAHEIAHQWFYGILANNESDYAWMDEGFTSYITTEALHYLAKRSGKPRHLGAYTAVVATQEMGLFERLNTPADWFLTNRGYAVASYAGGEMLVDLLGGVLSDSLRDAWLKRYYQHYKFRHPTPLNLEQLAEDISQMQLDWFFEQLTNMTRSCDYALKRIQPVRKASGWETRITLERKEPLILPLDLKLTFADGRTQWVHIPRLIAFGHKPVPPSWITTEPWPWTSREFTFTVEGRVTRAMLDPEARTPDRNRLNNAHPVPVTWRFLQPPASDWLSYQIGWQPVLDYAQHFGIGMGLQFRGQYFMGNHQLQLLAKIWPQHFNQTAIFRKGLDGQLKYQTFLPLLGKMAISGFHLQKHLGITEALATVHKPLGRFAPLGRKRQAITVTLGLQKRVSTPAFMGAFAPLSLDPDSFWTDALTGFVRLGYQLTGSGFSFKSTLESGATQTQPGYLIAEASFYKIYRKRSFLTRMNLYTRLSTGALPSQKYFALAHATPERQWQNPAFRFIAGALGTHLNTYRFTLFPVAGPLSKRVVNRLVATTIAIGWSQRKYPVEVNAYVSGAFGFSESSTLWSDAGFQLHVNLPELSLIRRWVQQSDILQHAYLTARYIAWRSDVELLKGLHIGIQSRW